jgi:carbon storage regulator
MLVLTRRQQQSIVIGTDIVITVLEVKGDQIRLGITAPRDVQVNREEVVAALAAANRSAVLPDGAAAGLPSVPAQRESGVHRDSGRNASRTGSRRSASRGRAA